MTWRAQSAPWRASYCEGSATRRTLRMIGWCIVVNALVAVYVVRAESNDTASSAAAGSKAAITNVTCDERYGRWDDATKRCVCKQGFSGWGCRMCASDAACSALGTNMECYSGIEYRHSSQSKTYACGLDPGIQALLPDGALSIYCDRAHSNCSAAVFKAKDTIAGAHVIDCHLTGCAFTDASPDVACKLIECKCGSSCSDLTKQIVEHSLSGKPVKVHADNATHVALEIEGSPIPLSGSCTASACEAGSGSGSSSGSGSGGDDQPSKPSALLIALITCASIAAFLLCLALCFSCMLKSWRHWETGDLEAELASLVSQSGATFEFNRVSCRPPQGSRKKRQSEEPRLILDKISGSVNRGSVLGLLGPSGSGKTSLLNALAAVENGHSKYSGEILVDGARVSKNYRKIAAYVQQDDTLFSTLTVRECIMYSAQLRLPSDVSERVKEAKVDRVIEELNLSHIAHSRIGSTGKSRGISGGERRRVSIGMELVTSPQILFLDEPTSGLDSSSANSVVQLMKELASHGRIVVLSIHQPSAKAFAHLDQIMLLAKGKRCYHGPPLMAKDHFEKLGFRCPENENIADFILDIAADPQNIPIVCGQLSDARGASHERSSAAVKIPQTPSESSPFMAADSTLDTPRAHSLVGSPQQSPSCPTPPSSCKQPSSPDEKSAFHRSHRELSGNSDAIPKRSLAIEVRVLFGRTARNILRHRALLTLHVFLSVMLGLFGGLIFNHVTNDLAGFQNRSGAFYFILTFFGFASMSSMDLFIAERPIFLRETGAMYYSAFSYFLAKSMLDTVMLRVLPATLFASIFYWIMGLQSDVGKFVLFSVTLVLFNVAAGSISVLVGVLCRTVGAANLSATVVFLVMLLFGGFLLNSQTMPVYVSWLKHFSIFSYAFEILMTNELNGLLLKFDAPGYPAVPVYGDVFLKTLGMDYANRFYDLIALGVIALALQVMAFLFLALQVPARHEIFELEEDKDGRDETITDSQEDDDVTVTV